MGNENKDKIEILIKDLDAALDMATALKQITEEQSTELLKLNNEVESLQEQVRNLNNTLRDKVLPNIEEAAVRVGMVSASAPI